MLGDDGKPFKTRSGGTVKLDALLDEAIERAHALISARESNLSDHQKQQVAMQVGIGAVKYADLSKHLTTDYVFDWDSMLSFEGNTAPYLQYAYTRIQSIFRKSDMALENAPIMVEHPQEKALAVKLLQLNEAIEQVATEATPHVLCSYLYDLAGVFMRFYESCPIIKQGTAQAVKVSRLQLTALTGHTLKAGLDILGIATPQQM
jgi:arginyl-tRNA synthetase